MLSRASRVSRMFSTLPASPWKSATATIVELNGTEERSSTKTYAVVDHDKKEMIVIDPVKEQLDRYISVAAYYGADITSCIDTHTHADHVSAVLDLKRLTGADIVMHRNAPMPFVDKYVQEGEKIKVGSTELEVLYTPGHTPDSLSLFDGKHVFTGDLILIGGTGRTDFAGGNPAESYDSITNKIFTLPKETVLLPGHDYRGMHSSTVGAEMESNPRLAGKTRKEYIEIMNNLGLALPEQIMEAVQVNSAAFLDRQAEMPQYSQLADIRQMDAVELQGRVLSGAHTHKDGDLVVLDVRTPEEFTGELGHIEGAMHIPIHEIVTRVSELKPFRKRHIVAVCRAGVRSTSAAAILTGLGFPHVSNLKGGMIAWRDQGF